MLAQTGTIDRNGRITLPQQILDALGVHTSQEMEVLVEMTEEGVIIKPKHLAHPITERIAAMALPVDDWGQMEQETELGRLA